VEHNFRFTLEKYSPLDMSTMKLPGSSPNETLPEHCRSLFVGDLSCFCREEDLYPVFQPFGSIESIRVMRGKDGKVLGYGFVTFFDMKAALDALQVDGQVVLGRPIKYDHFQFHFYSLSNCGYCIEFPGQTRKLRRWVVLVLVLEEG
jgi:RNA recognition motif-containing protein